MDHRSSLHLSRLQAGLLGSAILFSNVLWGAPASIAPVGLLCEDLENPLGIDVVQPRLSWILRPTDDNARSQAQTGFEIRVASTPARLQSTQPDLWDPGWQESNSSQSARYDGDRLRYGDQAFWQLRVKDEAGHVSSWSPVGHWSLGPFRPEHWQAQWIGTDQTFERQEGWPPPDNTLPDPWFRKTIDLHHEARRAFVTLASVGYHELYVNGRRIGDRVLSPAVSDSSQRARTITYDITRALHPGRNALGIWLGTSWSIFPPMQTEARPATPIVIAQAEIELADGEHLQVVTDATWKTHPSPNTLLGVWDFMHFGGESYDARQDLPDWCHPDLDEMDWKPATVYDPGLLLSAQMLEPNRRVHEIRARAVEEVWAGTLRIDMGVNFAGWVEIPVQGQVGDSIEFFWSERSDQEMTHRLHSTTIIGPTGRGVFRNRFNYGSGRWITVKGLRNAPDPDSVRGWVIRTDYARTGTFQCSDERLNRIYDTILWTFENLTLGGYVVDCPQRERMGYGGDGHATIETGLDNYRLPAFYAKWAEDWRDVQGKQAAWGVGVNAGEPGSGGDATNNGNLPYTAPTYWGGGGPSWSGFCITLPWEVYRRHGDLKILEDNYPTIERWLAFLETKASDNLLQRWGGKWDFLGDWLWPGAEGVNGDTRETLFFNNCYWIYNLETAARIAEALDHSETALVWRARAHRVRQAVHQEFFNPAESGYVNNSQAYLAIALLTDLPPIELRERVARRFEKEILDVRQGHFWGGITGGYFIVKQLTQANRPDLMYAMLTQDDYPGWGDMLAQGATTIWEDWEGKKSLLHSSYLHAGAWFIQGLAGIRPGPEGKGYRHFTIQPGIWRECPLTHAEATLDSPFGPIRSAWKQDQHRYLLTIRVPPGTLADLHLPPALATWTVTEDGRPIDRIPGVRTSGTPLTDNAVITLEPGHYELRAQPPTASATRSP